MKKLVPRIRRMSDEVILPWLLSEDEATLLCSTLVANDQPLQVDRKMSRKSCIRRQLNGEMEDERG